MRVLLLCMGCLLAIVAGDYESLFQTDITSMLNNETEWKAFFNCLMDREPCGQYQYYRDTVPKLVVSKCEGCTKEQKTIFDRTVVMFRERYRNEYREFAEKYGIEESE